MTGAVDFPLDVDEISFLASGGSRVRRSIRPSGLRILSEQVPGARSVTLGFWVPTGSRDENHDSAAAGTTSFGSTHFLEHLLFKGTARRSALDIAVAFDAVGGEHNAVTAKEYTCYYAKVSDRDLPMAVDVMVDMMLASQITEADFETERGVILEELAMGDDDPHSVCAENLFGLTFAGSPLARPIGGTPDDIAAASRDRVWQHYRSTYTPERLVVTAAGGIDHVELLRLVDEAFAAASAGRRRPVPRRSTAPSPLSTAGAVSVANRPVEQCHLMLGAPGLAATDPRRMTLSALNAILGGGMSSRLFQEVRELRGLAYSVYSSAPSYSDAGAFVLAAACSPAKAPEVAQVMREQLVQIAERGVARHEVVRVRGQLSGSAALALEDSDTRMNRLGRAELTLGEFADLDVNLARLGRVQADDIVELAAQLTAGPLSLAAVGAVTVDDFTDFTAHERTAVSGG